MTELVLSFAFDTIEFDLLKSHLQLIIINFTYKKDSSGLSVKFSGEKIATTFFLRFLFSSSFEAQKCFLFHVHRHLNCCTASHGLEKFVAFSRFHLEKKFELSAKILGSQRG